MPLGKNADAGDYVKDFEKSDAPQFKGKSKEKRRKMAIAAYLDSKDKKESKMKSFEDNSHFMYKDGKKVMVNTKADHDKYAAKGYTMNEISSNKLGDYMRKSSQSAAKPGQSARTQDKRIGGQSMADKKIRKKMGYSSTAKVPAGKNESVDEGFELDEAQKLFMFTSKAEAQKKAKQIGGKVLELKRAMDGNMFAVIHKDLTKEAFEEGIIGNLVKKTAKAAGGAVVNRLTTTGRAKIAQKKIDKHNTKQDQKNTIQKAKDAGKSAFGLTQKSRAANAKKKLDKIAKKKAALDTIQRAKDLKKKPPVTNEGLTKKSVETGKVKTGASNSRIAAMQKQDDNRPTLRKNEGKKMDSAAMKKAMDVFKKRGGKIKKVAPGKAAGYHGKDDPGKGVQGMMDRGDTKGFNRKKKVKSMR